jgi:pSer/pThr/pTyr-binding forkhead associated (FHA) protein
MTPSTPSNASATPSSPRTKALTRFLDRALDVMFGAPDPAPAPTPRRGGVEVDVLPPRSPKGEMLLNALAQAIAEFHYNEVRPYLKYSPHFRYQLHQVCLIRNPDNIGLVADFERLRREQRNLIVKAKFSELDGFDLSEFTDVRVVDTATNATDPVFVVAGDGPQRARLGVEFPGEFVELPAPASKSGPEATDAAPQPVNPPVRPSQAPTLMPDPTPPSRVATLAPEAPKASGAPALTLHIAEPGHPERSAVVGHFPARIGRGEDCEVVLLSPYVSRLHATVIYDGSMGTFRVADHSRVGTLLGTKALARDEEAALPDGAELTLAPSAAAGGVTVRVSLPAAPPAKPLRPSQTPTLMPPAELPAQPRGPSPMDPGAPRGLASKTLMERVEPVLFEDALQPAPIVRLRVWHANGKSELHDVAELPYDIGREPEGDNACAIADRHAKVSRQHLRITRQQAGVYNVSNLALGGNGTWVGGERMAERFTLKAVLPGSKDGWCILGERGISDNSVAVRLEQVA